MKKLFTIAVVLAVISLSAFAERLTDPTKANWFIKGTYSLSGNGRSVEYLLNDVSASGFSFTNEGTWRGNFVNEDEVVKFTFKNASTTYPQGLTQKLDFWYFDESIGGSGQWQRDVEVKQGVGVTQLSKQVTIIMIIDCSGSIGSEFQRVILGAKSFLEKMHAASNDGNLNIGIIGFSTINKTKVLPVQPLNDVTYFDMRSFIDNFQMGGGTALYYSIDKGVEMAINYADKIESGKYDNTLMLVFTDGIDNTSMDIDRGIMSADAYCKYAENLLKSTKIKNKFIDCTIIGIKGSDIITEAQATKFSNTLKGLSDDFTILPNFSQLQSKFEEIASGLVKRWQSLNCYIPPARQGQVCWTFADVEVPRVLPDVPSTPKVRTSGHFIGAHLGINSIFAFADKGSAYDIGIGFGVDYAKYLTPKFGLGAYLSFGVPFVPDVNFQSQFGLFMTGGSFEQKKSIFVGGIGADLGSGFCGVDLRAGAAFRKGFYLFAELGVGAASVYYNDYRGSSSYGTAMAMALSFHIGYNFGTLLKK